MLGFCGIQSIEELQQRLNLTNEDDEFNAKLNIKVLLVDHDQECLDSTAQMLELCSYKVSKVVLASTALSMLSHGYHFDVVIANIHSPDCKGFTLLEKAVAMKILVIFMSAEDEEKLAKNVLEKGAFLLVRKPVSLEFGKYLWQHVMRERLKNNKSVTNTNESQEAVTVNDKKNKSKGKKKVRDETSSPNNDRKNNKRMIIEWTSDLHFKFMDAVYQLGEGRCYPKEILEKMNVPGLTRLQIASHLQKCRNEIWQAPEVRKNLPYQHRRYHHHHHPSSQNNDMGSGKNKERVKKFGIMPPLQIISPNQEEENKDGSQRSDECYYLSENSEFFPNEEDSVHQLQPVPQMMPIGLKLSVENVQYYNAAFAAAHEYGNNNNNNTTWNQNDGNVLVNASDRNENLQTNNGGDDLFFEFPADMNNIINSLIGWNKGPQFS